MEERVIHFEAGLIFALDIFDCTVFGFVHDERAIRGVADDFICVGDDGSIGVYVPMSSSVADFLYKVSKAALLLELDELVDFSDDKAVLEVPLEQWSGQQDLSGFHSPHQ